jgi:2-iminobutanoate/2-iminopropanoate deaminase
VLKTLILMLSAITLFSATLMQSTVSAQAPTPSFEKKGYRHSKWGSPNSWEVVSVSGPRTLLYLSGVGAEDENSTGPDILHQGDFAGQCRYAFDKITRLLAKHGASLADVVKTTAYLTDVRFQTDYGKCTSEWYGDAPRTGVHTFIVISQLAHPGMMVEIDVTAMVPEKGEQSSVR